jgi:hypothetical protein
MAAVLATFFLSFDLFSQAQNDAVRAKRLVLVSIPDRKLAVMENGEVIARFPVAVGAAVSPSPQGKFEIVNRFSDGGIMQMAITFLAVIAGMVFSLAIALLAEELIFGQVFRWFFSRQVAGVKTAQKR